MEFPEVTAADYEIKTEEVDVSDMEFPDDTSVDYEIKTEEVDISDMEFPDDTSETEIEDPPQLPTEEKNDLSSDSFDCTCCRMSFPDGMTLALHKTNTCFKSLHPLGVIEKPFRSRTSFECDTCGGRFTLKRCMDAHMKVCKGENGYKRGMRAKRFICRGNLNTHLASHTKPHKCLTCDRRFAHRCYLKNHMTTHTGL